MISSHYVSVIKEMNIKIIRSKRRTIAVGVKNGEAVVRAPYYVTKNEIENFVAANAEWIAGRIAEQKIKEEKNRNIRVLTDAELAELKRQALIVVPARVRAYAPLVGVTFGRITVRSQKTRWGSCSAKGNLNFNLSLMRAPLEVLDYVVVHELTHRKHMNHSKEFWADVARVMPEYKLAEKWLKDHGDEIMRECGVK